ncbi:MAG: M4 family metallopeptidase [Holophagaceae bacterium]|nr:M4 family metallopeptidase [Holophagaceae bacterium]
MSGIGMDKAAKIWYRALSTYLTSSSNYSAARTAAISSAKDLYGAGGAEEQAVWNAFAAINVGSPWGGTPPPPPPPANTFAEVETNDTVAGANTVAKTFTAIQGNLTVATDKDFFALTLNPGETVAIAMTGPSGPDWDLKLVDSASTQLAISQGSTTTENLSYTNSGATVKTVYANAYAYSGTDTAPYTLGLTYSGGTAADTTAPTCAATESGTSGTITFSATASDNVGVAKVEFYVDGALKGTDTSSPYSMTLDSTTLANGSHTLVAKAYDAAGNIGTSTSVAFSVSNTTPPPATTYNEVESNGTTGAANVIASTVTKIVAFIGTSTDKDFFKITVPAGRTLTVNMTGPAKDYDLTSSTAPGRRSRAAWAAPPRNP